ncbi:hypothetical protein J7I94_19835 [Streptomyces sp. ISL-12]|nr:hypothetical protein [Streptomyces sp. ISL-12]
MPALRGATELLLQASHPAFEPPSVRLHGHDHRHSSQGNGEHGGYLHYATPDDLYCAWCCEAPAGRGTKDSSHRTLPASRLRQAQSTHVLRVSTREERRAAGIGSRAPSGVAPAKIPSYGRGRGRARPGPGPVKDGPRASVPTEVSPVPSRPFYDFEAKYLDSDKNIVPAPLTSQEVAGIQQLAVAAYEAISCEGLVRADFFLTEKGEFVINEVNTMPGFTPVSMYPRMWQESGVPYPELVDRLIQAALRTETGLR